MHSIGDTFIINNLEYTIWLSDISAYIDDNGVEQSITVYHLKNNQGHGICCDEEYLTNINL